MKGRNEKMKKIVFPLFVTSLLFSSPVWASEDKHKMYVTYENQRVVDVKQINPTFLSTAKNEVNRLLKNGKQFKLEKVKKFELVKGLDRRVILSFDWSIEGGSATVEIEEKTGRIFNAQIFLPFNDLRSDQIQIVQSYVKQINENAMKFNRVNITIDNREDTKEHTASFFTLNYNGNPNFIEIDLSTGKMREYHIRMDAKYADQKHANIAKKALGSVGLISQLREAVRSNETLRGDGSSYKTDVWRFETVDGDSITMGAKTGRVYSLHLTSRDFHLPDKEISSSEVTTKAKIILEKVFGMDGNDFKSAYRENKHRYSSYIMEKKDGTVAFIDITKKGEIDFIKIKTPYLNQD